MTATKPNRSSAGTAGGRLVGAWRRLKGPWRIVVAAVVALVLFAIVVLIARWLRTMPAVEDFIADYPGTVPPPGGEPLGFPAWVGWQHFLNSFFLLLIVRTGLQIRSGKRPPAFWTRRNTGPFRTKRAPRRMSIHVWLHLTLDALWVVNGVVFIVLLFTTGQWARLVPTSWAVVPNAISVGLQYASLDWPVENSWVAYNALQQLAYFAVVFIASPLALVSGLRLSHAWPHNGAAARIVPIRFAHAVHFPVMVFFLVFVVVHVTLVFTTGALRNLNHMYAASDGDGWVGFIIFAISIVVMVVGWMLARPALLVPVAKLSGDIRR